MAEEKLGRAALLAARKRERRIDIKGPPTRRGPREVEDERIERGRRTLGEAYGGVPSRADFLKRADLFEFSEGSARVERAFIVPNGVDTIENGFSHIFWYRRNTTVSLPTQGSSVRVSSRNGDIFTILIEETIAERCRVKLKSKNHERTCTGSVLCRILKSRERSDESDAKKYISGG